MKNGQPLQRTTTAQEIELKDARFWSDPEVAGRALDVGSGEGRMTPVLARRAPKVTDIVGLDIDERKVRRHPSGIIGDASHLPFKGSSFDVALAIEVLEHVDDPARCLAEIFRVLRPGGQLLLSCPISPSRNGRLVALMRKLARVPSERQLETTMIHRHVFTAGDVLSLLKSAGFRAVRTLYSKNVYFLYRLFSKREHMVRILVGVDTAVSKLALRVPILRHLNSRICVKAVKVSRSSSWPGWTRPRDSGFKRGRCGSAPAQDEGTRT